MTPQIYLRKGRKSLLCAATRGFSGAIDYIKAERIGNRRRRSGRSIHPFGRIHRAGHYQIGSIVRVLSFCRRRSIRSGGTAASPWRTTFAARWDLRTIPTRTATGWCTARATPGLACQDRGHHGTAAVVQCHSVGIPPHGDRQGDTGDLRRQNHGHLRQSSQTVPYNARLGAVDSYPWGSSDLIAS